MRDTRHHARHESADEVPRRYRAQGWFYVFDVFLATTTHAVSILQVLHGGEWLQLSCDDYDPTEDEQNGEPPEYYMMHTRSPYLLPYGTAREYCLPLTPPLVNGALLRIVL